MAGRRAQAESKQADAPERALPLPQDADWFLRSSWYIYITGREQMGWKLNRVGRGHESGIVRPHGVSEQITKAVLQLGEDAVRN